MVKKVNREKCILISEVSGDCPECGTKLVEIIDAKGLFTCPFLLKPNPMKGKMVKKI